MPDLSVSRSTWGQLYATRGHNFELYVAFLDHRLGAPKRTGGAAGTTVHMIFYLSAPGRMYHIEFVSCSKKAVAISRSRANQILTVAQCHGIDRWRCMNVCRLLAWTLRDEMDCFDRVQTFAVRVHTYSNEGSVTPITWTTFEFHIRSMPWRRGMTRGGAKYSDPRVGPSCSSLLLAAASGSRA